MPPATVHLDNLDPVVAALQRLEAAGRTLRPALTEIGEALLDSTRARFAAARGPDGSPWAPNSAVTIARYLGSTASWRRKDGRLSVRGERALATKRPLTGRSRALSTTLRYQVAGNRLELGSGLVYAAMHQFGGSKARFPHLWGSIPARPYLGLSADDRSTILRIVARHLQG